MTKKVLVCGCGGIASYLAQHIDSLTQLRQMSSWEFVFYDDDKVETKNILYQNFKARDIGHYKTDALGLRYFNIEFETKRVDKIVLSKTNFSLLILCADNNIIRREAWECAEKTGVHFIDARANGRAVGIFSSETENYLNTLDKSTESSSCQNPFQVAKQEIEYGNVVVAAMLAQVILRYTRTKKLPNDILLNF